MSGEEKAIAVDLLTHNDDCVGSKEHMAS